MKKSTGGMLIVAGACVCGGIGLSIAGLILGGAQAFSEMVHDGTVSVPYFDYEKHSTDCADITDAADADYRFDNVKNLDIDIGASSMSISAYDGNQVLVSFDGTVRNLSCEMNGDTLELDVKKSDHINMQVPKALLFEDTDLEVGAGELSVDGIRTKTLSIDCGVGEAVFTGHVEGDAELECGIGNLELYLDRAQEDYAYDISCGVGNVDYGTQSYSGIIKDSSNDDGTKPLLDIKCGIGNVTVGFSK